LARETGSKDYVRGCAWTSPSADHLLRRYGFHQALGSFGFRRECDQFISIEIDEGGYKSIEITHWIACSRALFDEPSFAYFEVQRRKQAYWHSHQFKQMTVLDP
jgi:hypothetical protein